MRSVSGRAGRVAAFVAAVSIIVAPMTYAASNDDRDPGQRLLKRAKQFVVSVLSRLGGPPG